MKRRTLLKTMAGISALTSTGLLFPALATRAQTGERQKVDYKIKLSLNAFSFNRPLRDGEMDLFDLLEFCAGLGFDAVDPTAYYFPGYPEVPPDDYLFEFKRQAFLKGLAISGTGVRNDFGNPDENTRRNDLIKNWIVAASKMGAPVIRVFARNTRAAGLTREQILERMVEDIRECAEYGKQHGVIVAVQNHNSFLKTAAQTRELIERVDHEWFGLILDTGSYREGDPYLEISEMIPHAVSWQLKELIYHDGDPSDVDLDKMVGIIRAGGYRGYVPIETLGPGDPRVKVTEFLQRFRTALSATP